MLLLALLGRALPHVKLVVGQFAAGLVGVAVGREVWPSSSRRARVTISCYFLAGRLAYFSTCVVVARRMRRQPAVVPEGLAAPGRKLSPRVRPAHASPPRATMRQLCGSIRPHSRRPLSLRRPRR